MGLLSSLKRSASVGETGAPEELRRRARRRLIGATVLVLIGVVGLPLLFDTAPRPVAVDIPIEIPAKDKISPLNAVDGRAVASGKLAPIMAEPAGGEGKATGAVVQPQAEPASVPPAEPTPVPPADTKPLIDPTPAPPRPAAVTAPPKAAAPVMVTRYVVQVGAFSEAASAREARQRVERLGLKTYTQVVSTPAGARTRVRVGPYDERADAERTAAKIKQAGLPAAVLGL